MVTRLYLSSTVAAHVNPAFETGWTQTTGADRRKCSVTKSASAMTDATMAGVNGTTLIRQYVSPPMNAQTILAGTVKGTIRVAESATNDNILQICVSIKVVNRGGDTYGGTDILAKGQYGPSNEWPTYATGNTNRRIADGDATTQVTVNQGDRLVIHLGYYVSSGTSIAGRMNFGDDSASDCADNETGTDAFNPFIELSQTIAWEAVIYYKSASITEVSGITPSKRQKRVIAITETSGITTIKKQQRLIALTEFSTITASLKKVYKLAASITTTTALAVRKIQARLVAVQESSLVQALKQQRRQSTITITTPITVLKKQRRPVQITSLATATSVKRVRRAFAVTSVIIISGAKRQRRNVSITATAIVSFLKQYIPAGGQVYHLAFSITETSILSARKTQRRIINLATAASLSVQKIQRRRDYIAVVSTVTHLLQALTTLVANLVLVGRQMNLKLVGREMGLTLRIEKREQ